MKKKMCQYAFVLFFAFVLTACTEEKYYSEYYVGAEISTEVIEIPVRSWEWNSVYNRYEYVLPYPEIDDYIYEYGVVQASVFVQEEGMYEGKPITFETLKTLPFVQSYYSTPTYTYTETISFDISPGSISFYIQASDLSDTDEYLQTYYFKVSTFYNK